MLTCSEGVFESYVGCVVKQLPDKVVRFGGIVCGTLYGYLGEGDDIGVWRFQVLLEGLAAKSVLLHLPANMFDQLLGVLARGWSDIDHEEEENQ